MALTLCHQEALWTFYLLEFNPPTSAHSAFVKVKVHFDTLDSLKWLCADGHEASAIYQKFGSTIPWNYKSHNNIQYWYGDVARTILASLL